MEFIGQNIDKKQHEMFTDRRSIPSPDTRFNVDGLVGSVGRAVGAGVAVACYPFQRLIVRVHGQTHF